MTATSAKHAVYVSDDNGWLDGCPDHCGAFFGAIPAGGTYVGPRASEFGGHVEFSTAPEADAFAEQLDESGDWIVKAPGHEHEGEERRPSYAVAEIDAK